MKKIAAISAICMVLVVGLFMFLSNSPAPNMPMREPAHSQKPTKDNILQKAPTEFQDVELVEPPTEDNFPITKEQFESLSKDDQNQILEEFVDDFWETESGISDETTAGEKRLSLEIFNRPYMRTLTEREYLQLSPEDREKADAEIGENCRQIRSFVLNVVAETDSLIAAKDYLDAEAYLVNVLEMGRELTFNKENLALTRLVGISCENRALDGMIKLYTRTGNNARVQMAREQISENQKEIKEIANMVQQSEANN
jgi:hypothetical protein